MNLDKLKAHLQGGGQILKTREDQELVLFESDFMPGDANKPFVLSENTTHSWINEDENFGPGKLRERIEPWLTALAQSEHFSLLLGSGLTHAVHAIAADGPLPGMSTITFDVMNSAIEAEAKRTAELAGRDIGNFEDQVRAANELLRGLEIIASAKADKAAKREEKIKRLRDSLRNTLESFAFSILEGERNLVSAPVEKREQAFNHLVSFLLSFASRTGTRERLHLFTTNYDRYLEAGADVAGLRLIDRFVGTLEPVFRASRLDVDLHYNPPGIRGEPRYLEGVARFTKLHGSIDWVNHGRAIRRIGLPFGADTTSHYLSAPGFAGANAMRLMIYPNSAKDRETAAYPYVELFRDFAAAICRPNSTVVCYGYSFGDEHINRILEDMLTIPSTHLVVIAYGDPLGRILSTYKSLGRHAQISLLIGDYLGDLQTLINYLPKPAIDRTTFRMAELLKSRWHANSTGDGKTDSNLDDDKGADE